MAKKKKTTKPTANPSRGFATTSLPSKARAEPTAEEAEPAPPSNKAPPSSCSTTTAQIITSAAAPAQSLSPDDFERQLEESDLQLLVEKYAQKVKRDAQRQKTRLETDRRLLRGQAETLNMKKWLPQELMDHVLDLIHAEGRFAASSVSSEGASSRLLPEEELTVRLWTLRRTLDGLGFLEEKINAALQFVLDIAPNLSPKKKRDSIWALEEALEWLARETAKDELPDYSARSKANQKSDSSADSLLPPGATTSSLLEVDQQRGKSRNGSSKSRVSRNSSPKPPAMTFDEDIDPDDLQPIYMDAKEKLFAIQRPRQDLLKGKEPVGKPGQEPLASADDQEEALLLAKVARVEHDVLFDKVVAERLWKARRAELQTEYIQSKRMAAEEKREKAAAKKAEGAKDGAADVNSEAEQIAAEILAETGDQSDDDLALSDLFSSLPIDEVDPVTGKTNTVMSGDEGSRVVIRDFGKWTGVEPSRILEEACRARDSSVKISYQRISDVAFANRHLVNIAWLKPQEITAPPELPELESFASANQFIYKMASIACPDVKQSEAYIATTALFFIYGSSAKGDKISMRLPSTWKSLWNEFAEIRKNKADEENRNEVRRIRELVRQRMEQEEEDGVILQSAFRRAQNKNAADSDLSDPERTRRELVGPEYYQNIWRQKSNTHRFQQMLQARMQLPIWQFRQAVVDAVERQQVVIICGETGCGKSTQVPTFLLESQLSQGRPCKIYCTEPRRISAISLARRVSDELGEGRSDLGTSRSLVGYSIRLEANTSKETRLVYATTGIVMRMLEGSNDLQEITHLVLDEVHERSIDSDFLLIVLKKLLIRRQDLKVVLMSATVDAERFSKYLGNAPVLNVPGRTFPVQVAYLEDAIELTGYTLQQGNQHEKVVSLDDDVEKETDHSAKPDLVKELKNYSPRTRSTLAQMDEYQIDMDLIVQLITCIATDQRFASFSKAILVFLPGIAEIRNLNDLLLGDKFFSENWLVYPLHSTIATEDQEVAFLVPPPGMRKIVIATNIAETGITIPDVTCVIDTGRHREMRFDERRQLSRLIDTFISRANAKQRRGRAGRVQEGLCFHMFTKNRHDHLMNDQQTPEMLRLSLQDLAIRVKICKIGGIEETLSQALDPPSHKNIRRAIDALVDVRALTPAEDLTPLGQQLARLPLDVFLGKLILYGAVFKCLDMALTVAAILSSKSPFVAPFGQRSQADTIRRGFRRGDSDLLTVYNAYLAWKRVAAGVGGEFQFCRKNFLSPPNLANIEDLKGQLLVSVVDSGFLQLTSDERQNLNRLRFGGKRRHQIFFDVPQRANINSENDTVVQSVVAWSFYPKLLVRDMPGEKGLRNLGNNQNISLHPSSVNKDYKDLRWLSYYHIMQSSSKFYNAHETTAVEPFAIALLCGDVRIDMFAGVIALDSNRARFALPDWKTMLVVKALRVRLREILTRCFRHPGRLVSQQHQRWLDAWQMIFAQFDEAKWRAKEREKA